MTFLRAVKILVHDQRISRIILLWQSAQAKLYGKGLNNNTIADVTVSDTGFVSEQQTDFIFSVVGEETGFIGSVIVIALLAIIMIECFKTAYVAKNMSGRLIAVRNGCADWFPVIY